MGRVYSPETVAAGNISLVPRHREAAAFVLNALFPQMGRFELYAEPLFEAGLVYGSTVDGPGPNIRSDVDILAIHRPGSEYENEAQRIMRQVVEQAESTYKVCIEPQLYTAGRVAECADPLYAEHILDMGKRQRQWCINDATKEFTDCILKPEDKTGRLLHGVRYLYTKAAEFERAINEYVGFAEYSVLQRAFELPSAIGRKILPATVLKGEKLPPISDKAGMRALVEKRTSGRFDSSQATCLIDDQRQLQKLDTAYSNLLVDTLKRITSLTTYDSWLEDNYHPACERAERIARSWAVNLEDTFLQIAPERAYELDKAGNDYYDTNDYS